jgi:ribonuclease HI
MQAAKVPHYLLFSECCPIGLGDNARGQWRFVLESVDGAGAEGAGRFEAADEERQAPRDRLELLAVVRGLEALEQPSKVTLVTPSRYVSRGMRYGLHAWRESNWQWERFGKMAPVKNSDLWRRVARALEFHQVECRTWRFDPPVGKAEASGSEARGQRPVKGPVAARTSADRPASKTRLAAWFERLLPERSHTPPPVTFSKA